MKISNSVWKIDALLYTTTWWKMQLEKEKFGLELKRVVYEVFNWVTTTPNYFSSSSTLQKKKWPCQNRARAEASSLLNAFPFCTRV